MTHSFAVGLRPFAFLVLAAAVIGCGGGKSTKLVPVSGKVTIDGQPITGGTINFRPDESKGNTNKAIPSGMIDSSGNYKLFTDGKEGAPLGAYKVGIGPGMNMGSGEVSKDPKASLQKVQFNMKYQNPDNSGISIEVVDSPPAGAYDLKVTK